MTKQDQFQNQSLQTASFVKPVLVGAGIALLVISFFVFGVDTPHPDWPQYWQVRPLIITPLAGACGGAFYAFMEYQAARGFNRTLAIIIGFVGFIIALWLGTILGLDGTMWN